MVSVCCPWVRRLLGLSTGLSFSVANANQAQPSPVSAASALLSSLRGKPWVTPDLPWEIFCLVTYWVVLVRGESIAMFWGVWPMLLCSLRDRVEDEAAEESQQNISALRRYGCLKKWLLDEKVAWSRELTWNSYCVCQERIAFSLLTLCCVGCSLHSVGAGVLESDGRGIVLSHLVQPWAIDLLQLARGNSLLDNCPKWCEVNSGSNAHLISFTDVQTNCCHKQEARPKAIELNGKKSLHLQKFWILTRDKSKSFNIFFFFVEWGLWPTFEKLGPKIRPLKFQE